LRKKRIAVCFAQVPFNRGGAEILVEDLVCNLDRRGFSVDKISLPFKWYPHVEILKNVLAWRLLDLSEANGEKIDLVIGTKFPSYVVKHDNKVVWLVHQFREAYDLFGTEYSDLGSTDDARTIREQIIKIDNISLGESRAIYTISKNVAGRLKKYNNIDGIKLYPPPRNYKVFKNNEYGDYIFSISRLDRKKRIDLLIKSLMYTDSQLKCIIVGRGSERNNLQKLTTDLNLTDRVKFVDFVDDKELVNLYAGCFSVFNSPLDEDYGYVTVEALLSRKPVITTDDSGGVLEFISEGVGGKICSLDPVDIGQQINKLFYNKNLCADLGNEGHNIVKDMNWDSVIDALTSTLR
jgi:glycosyltransferase involved in cell wall biosynthesis